MERSNREIIEGFLQVVSPQNHVGMSHLLVAMHTQRDNFEANRTALIGLAPPEYHEELAVIVDRFTDLEHQYRESVLLAVEQDMERRIVEVFLRATRQEDSGMIRTLHEYVDSGEDSRMVIEAAMVVLNGRAPPEHGQELTVTLDRFINLEYRRRESVLAALEQQQAPVQAVVVQQEQGSMSSLSAPAENADEDGAMRPQVQVNENHQGQGGGNEETGDADSVRTGERRDDSVLTGTTVSAESR